MLCKPIIWFVSLFSQRVPRRIDGAVQRWNSSRPRISNSWELKRYETKHIPI